MYQTGRISTVQLIARHNALECLLTFVLLFCVTTIVRWVAGPSPARGDPTHSQLLIVGATVGLLLAGLIRSPAGKASGGHLNPAITLAMWRFGDFPGRRSCPTSSLSLSAPFSVCSRAALLGARQLAAGISEGRHQRSRTPRPGSAGARLATSGRAGLLGLAGLRVGDLRGALLGHALVTERLVRVRLLHRGPRGLLAWHHNHLHLVADSYLHRRIRHGPTVVR